MKKSLRAKLLAPIVGLVAAGALAGSALAGGYWVAYPNYTPWQYKICIAPNVNADAVGTQIWTGPTTQYVVTITDTWAFDGTTHNYGPWIVNSGAFGVNVPLGRLQVGIQNYSSTSHVFQCAVSN